MDCLVTEINVNNKKVFFTCLYRSPSRSHDELEHFCTNFDLLHSNISNLHVTCTIVLGDFNPKFSKWYASEQHLVPINWLINQLIISVNCHHTKNCGAEQSPYEKCHHNIICRTLNFSIPFIPPYFRETWDYKKANIWYIQKLINNFDWTKAFQKQNSIRNIVKYIS